MRLLPRASTVSRPRRLSGFSYLGLQQYSLTFCTRERKPTFVNPDVVATTLAQFRQTAVELRFAVLAYCLMPDHVHLLIEGLADTSDLRKFAKLAKQRAGAQYSFQRAKRCGRKVISSTFFAATTTRDSWRAISSRTLFVQVW